ncbi:MAG: hypothetical protein KBA51_07165, partial [Kiritimatiellae bacterium]|nr:hypothetical protein [Kiritimatiellia bacterium]
YADTDDAHWTYLPAERPRSVDEVRLLLPQRSAGYYTYAVMMAGLVGVALLMVYVGGQVSVIVTDFLQGTMCNIVFAGLVLYFLCTMDWAHIASALSAAPAEASLINPFRTSQVEDFNFPYFLIGMIGMIYNTMSWQGTQAYNSSGRNAHETKMAGILGSWRNFPRSTFLMLIPIVAITAMSHSTYEPVASQVQTVLNTMDSEMIQSQMRTPLVLRFMLPPGLLGAFAAVMLAAFLSTHNTYLHSWGCILVQDVVLPFRRRPLSAKAHIAWLRVSIAAVAVFIYAFSLLFQPSQHIYLFFAITGAIFVGGSGAVIIGGLYWRRGTTAAAWAALITGSGISVAGIILHELARQNGTTFPINGQWFWALSMAGATLMYVLVSLLGPRRTFDLDRLLRRGIHADPLPPATRPETASLEFPAARDASPRRFNFWRWIGAGREYTRGDRGILIMTYSWTLVCTAVFIIGTMRNLGHPRDQTEWLRYWQVYVWIFTGLSVAVTLWLAIGGVLDLRRMFRDLRELKRDDADDGTELRPKVSSREHTP